MIFDPNTFEKLIEVEGEHYRRFRSKRLFGDNSFDALLEEWGKHDLDDPKFKNGPTFSMGTIYGDGGWHRYIVRNSGEILFLRSAARGWPTSEHELWIKKARMVGFRIFPEDLP